MYILWLINLSENYAGSIASAGVWAAHWGRFLFEISVIGSTCGLFATSLRSVWSLVTGFVDASIGHACEAITVFVISITTLIVVIVTDRLYGLLRLQQLVLLLFLFISCLSTTAKFLTFQCILFRLIFIGFLRTLWKLLFRDNRWTLFRILIHFINLNLFLILLPPLLSIIVIFLAISFYRLEGLNLAGYLSLVVIAKIVLAWLLDFVILLDQLIFSLLQILTSIHNQSLIFWLLIISHIFWLIFLLLQAVMVLSCCSTCIFCRFLFIGMFLLLLRIYIWHDLIGDSLVASFHTTFTILFLLLESITLPILVLLVH